MHRDHRTRGVAARDILLVLNQHNHEGHTMKSLETTAMAAEIAIGCLLEAVSTNPKMRQVLTARLDFALTALGGLPADWQEGVADCLRTYRVACSSFPANL